MYEIKINKYMKKRGPIVYALYKDGKVVYIGESKVGVNRPLSHLKDKDFDKIVYIIAPKFVSLRRELESFLIAKYEPFYNQVRDNIDAKKRLSNRNKTFFYLLKQ